MLRDAHIRIRARKDFFIHNQSIDIPCVAMSNFITISCTAARKAFTVWPILYDLSNGTGHVRSDSNQISVFDIYIIETFPKLFKLFMQCVTLFILYNIPSSVSKEMECDVKEIKNLFQESLANHCESRDVEFTTIIFRFVNH